MIENAEIAKLWQVFHHLSENDKDLVLSFAEAAGHSARDTPAVQEQSRDLHRGAWEGKKNIAESQF